MVNRIQGFDGLRAIAVILVFMQHFAPISGGWFGILGVWAFFVLSGFLITGILTAQRRRIQTGMTSFSTELKTFLFRRTLRIFPIYYLLLFVVTVGFAIGFLKHKQLDFVGGMPYHFVYLSNVWIGSVLEDWAGPFSHFWSLAVEEQFYLFYAPLLLLIPTRWHWTACLTIVGISIALLWAFKSGGAKDIMIGTNSLTNFWILTLGGIGFQLIGEEHSKYRRYLTHPAVGAILLAIIVLFCAKGDGLDVDAGPARYAITRLLFALSIVSLVCWLVCNQSSVSVRFLENRHLSSLGKISYGFYLYHNFAPAYCKPFVEPLVRKIQATALGASIPITLKLVAVVLYFIGAVILAKLSWRFVEAPILRMRDRQARIQPTVAIASSP